jgi:hypothetical protein
VDFSRKANLKCQVFSFSYLKRFNMVKNLMEKSMSGFGANTSLLLLRFWVFEKVSFM